LDWVGVAFRTDLYVTVGRPSPVPAGSSGVIMAAFGGGSEPELEALFSKVAWYQKPSFAEFLARVKGAKKCGFAVDRGAMSQGITLVSVPVLSPTWELLLILTAAGHSHDLDAEALGALSRAIQSAAARLSESARLLASSRVHSSILVQPARMRHSASSADISTVPSEPILRCRPEKVCTHPGAAGDWAVRPVAEIFHERDFGQFQTRSTLIGATHQDQHDVALRRHDRQSSFEEAPSHCGGTLLMAVAFYAARPELAEPEAAPILDCARGAEA
jgi:hypothetical protein